MLISIFSRVCSLTSSVGCMLLSTKSRIIFAFSHTRTLLTHLQLVTHHIPSPFLNSCSLGPWSIWCVCTVKSSHPACVHIELHPCIFQMSRSSANLTFFCKDLKKSQLPVSNTAKATEGLCRMEQKGGAGSGDGSGPGTSLVVHPGKGSQCGKLCVHTLLVPPQAMAR